MVKNRFKATNPKMQPLFDKWKAARDSLQEYEHHQLEDPTLLKLKQELHECYNLAHPEKPLPPWP